MRNCDCDKPRIPYHFEKNLFPFVFILLVVLVCLYAALTTKEKHLQPVTKILDKSGEMVLTVQVPESCKDGPNRVKESYYGRIKYEPDIVLFTAEMICDKSSLEIEQYTQYLSVPTDYKDLKFRWSNGIEFTPYKL